MKHISQLFFIFSVFIQFLSCSQKPESQTMENTILDRHSFAQPNEAVVVHQHLDLKIKFDQKQIEGTTTLTIRNKTRKNVLVLDTKDLSILGVFLEDEHHPTAYSYLQTDSILGKALKISISSDENQRVLVKYKTSIESQALQWLNPEQTAGKKHPFLFTQGQAILSRTWFPCQDSPGIRFTYSADVEVDDNLKVVMSAGIQESTGKGRFHFELNKPIPAYLIALAAGNIDFKAIDERTGVYAEPEMLEKSHHEFSEMGKMVKAAESLYGDYRWGRYDLLVLPPSFPFGGMENPCVTFATPTILAGDRSLTSLVAHELAHSWSGNLVTNATWNDFWLNEGFTVYFERRIMEELEGDEYAAMLACIGFEDLKLTLDELGHQNKATCLKLNLDGSDPDDGMNDIAYEKGYLLLMQIEAMVGRKKWDVFLRNYFDENAFQSMTTERFLNYIEEKLLKINGLTAQSLDLNSWIYQPGLPQKFIQPVSARLQNAKEEAQNFAQTGETKKEIYQSWSSHEWVHFLRHLPADISIQRMEKLDQEFELTRTGNSEVLFQWLLLTVRRKYHPGHSRLKDFLVQTGRRKFVMPLYSALLETKEGRALGKEIYNIARANYHAVTYQSVDNLFKE